MDSSKLTCPLSTEEWADFNFPVSPRYSDTANLVSSQTCCSDDAHSLPSSVEGYASSSTVVESRSSDEADLVAYMRLGWDSSNRDSNSYLHSPEFPESPCSILLSCPPSWLELQPELEEEATGNNEVPLSSSPPEFTSSSPASGISSEPENEEGSSSLTSASSGARSDPASISSSRHFDCGPRPDQFSQRLHELLLLVLRGRELERSRIRDEETECTTCTSRSGDSIDSGFEYSGNVEQIVVTKIRTSNPPSRAVTRSPTVLNKWFSDQGFVGHSSSSKQSRYVYFRAYMR